MEIKKTTKVIILISVIILVLVIGFYITKYNEQKITEDQLQGEKISETEEVLIREEKMLKSSDSLTDENIPINYITFREDILGIEFLYPEAWGEIKGTIYGSERKEENPHGGYGYNFTFNGKVDKLRAGGRSYNFSAGRGGYIADFKGFGDMTPEEICSKFRATKCEIIEDSIISMVVIPKYDNICPPNPGQYPFSKVVAINLPDNSKINGIVFEYNFLSTKLRQELYNDILGDKYEKCEDTNFDTKKTFDAKADEIMEQITSKTTDNETLKNIEGFDNFVESITLY